MVGRSALIVLFLVTCAPRAHAQWTEDANGKTAVLRGLRSSMFPHPSRPQYTNGQVLAFVPAGLQAGPTVDIVIHYHGHRAEAVSSANQRRLREQLVRSGKSAILLAPQGPLRANDSAPGRHGEAGGLQRFVEESVARLVADGVLPPGTRPGRVILSGHSGAYLVISQALDRGGQDVSEVWLHDGLYGQVPSFVRWASRPGRRLVSTHTPTGGTRGNNGTLLTDLRAAGVPVVTSQDQVQGARAAVIAVPESHDAATDRFEAFARTSSLRARSTTPAGPAPEAPPARGRGLIDRLPR